MLNELHSHWKMKLWDFLNQEKMTDAASNVVAPPDYFQEAAVQKLKSIVFVAGVMLLILSVVMAYLSIEELSNSVPRFWRRNGNGKNPDSQGFKSGNFLCPRKILLAP